MESQLNDEFAKLGFEYKNMTTHFEKDFLIAVHSISLDNVNNTGLLEFSFGASNGKKPYSSLIDWLYVTLKRSNEIFPLMREVYFALNDPLPTKDQISAKAIEQLRISEVREKFSIGKGDQIVKNYQKKAKQIRRGR